MLKQGDQFPSITLNLVDGGAIRLPDDMPTRYAVLLFYRGYWWTDCKRQLAAFQEKLPELESLGVSVYAGSIDPLEYARQVVDRGITFPIAYRVTKEQAELTGAWWQDSLGFIEPAEFVLGRGGIVLGSIYSSGAVGHTDVNDVIDLIQKRERRTL